MRALVLNYQDDEQARAAKDEYLFGPDLLVAPIVNEGTQRPVYLPAGAWIDYWTGTQIAGGKTIVSDELAAAITDYAQVMASVGDSGVIEFPAVGQDGTVGMSRLLLGPASQIFVEPITTDGSNLDDTEVVAELRARIRAAGVQHAAPMEPDDSTPEDYAL